METPETWKDVPGFEGRYAVSDLGRVYSYYLDGPMSPGRTKVNGRGYKAVWLQSGGKANRRIRTVHSLVAEAFLGPCPEGMEVCHNELPNDDNRLSNLRYDTPLANNRDKIRHGTAQRGESSSQAVLTEQDVLAIRASRLPQKELGERYGCTFSNISAIQRRKSWTHL